MVMKFYNFDIFYQICYIFDLSSALACRVESIKKRFGNVFLYNPREVSLTMWPT